MLKVIISLTVIVFVGVVLFIFSPFNKAPGDLNHYYKCTKCRCVYGAMHGKGPYLKLPKNKGNWCIHDWALSSKAEFDQFAFEFLKGLDADKK